MSKFIRFDEDHFGYLSERMTPEMAKEFAEVFADKWPGKTIIFMQAEEFIDLTGQYEIVPIADEVMA